MKPRPHQLYGSPAASPRGGGLSLNAEARRAVHEYGLISGVSRVRAYSWTNVYNTAAAANCLAVDMWRAVVLCLSRRQMAVLDPLRQFILVLGCFIYFNT